MVYHDIKPFDPITFAVDLALISRFVPLFNNLSIDGPNTLEQAFTDDPLLVLVIVAPPPEQHNRIMNPCQEKNKRRTGRYDDQ